MACILLWSYTVRVRDSHAYRKMDVTREHISCVLELREILLSIQTCFNLVSAAVVCAILESLGLEPSSLIIEPRYLKLVTIVKRHKLQWYAHVSRSSGLAKTILQGTVKGG